VADAARKIELGQKAEFEHDLSMVEGNDAPESPELKISRPQ
jgi:hypothetical protein